MAYKRVEKTSDGVGNGNSFAEAKARGDAWEAVVKTALQDASYNVRTANRDEQRLGIDFYATKRGDALTAATSLKIECKLDDRAAETGHIFIELTTGQKLGCIFTTTSDYLVWSIGERVLIVRPQVLRDIFAQQSERLTLKVCYNPNGYSSSGVLFNLDWDWLRICTYPKNQLTQVLGDLCRYHKN